MVSPSAGECATEMKKAQRVFLKVGCVGHRTVVVEAAHCSKSESISNQQSSWLSFFAVPFKAC